MSNDGAEGHRWFSVRTLSMKSNELKHIIEQKIRHSYVEKYIQKPFIDNDKIFILNYLYNDLQMPLNRKKEYITTIMLVQIALDTHELVPSNGSNQMSDTEKQLSVLAGDYYSGLYYLLLAELEDIKMIQILGTAIRMINEQKMNLFYENVQTIDELFFTIQNIESVLFTEVANHIGIDEFIISIMEELLIINRLYREKESIRLGKFSYITKFVENHTSNSSDAMVIEKIEAEIDKHEQKMDELLLKLPYHFISLKNLIRHKVKLSYNTSVAEEG